MEVRIDKGIPIPEFLVVNYPWDDLDVGDSFLIRAIHNEAMRLLVDAGRKRPDRIFHVQKMEKGVYRVWLVKIKEAIKGDLEPHCKLFMAAIRACVHAGVIPSNKLIINRRPQLKSLLPGQWDAIVKILVERGDLMVDATGGKVSYRSMKPPTPSI